MKGLAGSGGGGGALEYGLALGEGGGGGAGPVVLLANGLTFGEGGGGGAGPGAGLSFGDSEDKNGLSLLISPLPADGLFAGAVLVFDLLLAEGVFFLLSITSEVDANGLSFNGCGGWVDDGAGGGGGGGGAEGGSVSEGGFFGPIPGGGGTFRLGPIVFVTTGIGAIPGGSFSGIAGGGTGGGPPLALLSGALKSLPFPGGNGGAPGLLAIEGAEVLEEPGGGGGADFLTGFCVADIAFGFGFAVGGGAAGGGPLLTGFLPATGLGGALFFDVNNPVFAVVGLGGGNLAFILSTNCNGGQELSSRLRPGYGSIELQYFGRFLPVNVSSQPTLESNRSTLHIHSLYRGNVSA